LNKPDTKCLYFAVDLLKTIVTICVLCIFAGVQTAFQIIAHVPEATTKLISETVSGLQKWTIKWLS